jgi:hypothetical protein
MKKIILSIIFLFFFTSKSTSHVGHYENFDYLEYELFRNNKLIGYHKYDFIRDNNNLSVKSEVSFKISKLGVDLYKYYAKSNEVYKDNKFFQFSSETTQNKKEKYVNININSTSGELIIDGSSYKGNAPIDSIVGTWWNHEIVKAKRQISAISGRIIEQTVTFVGKEEIKIGAKTYNALHFNFKSADKSLPNSKKLNTDIWYEEKSLLWLKASFDKTGYWEYRLSKFK